MKSSLGFALFCVSFLLNQYNVDADCIALVAPAGGTLSSTAVTPGTTVTLMCSPGVVSGVSSVTCPTAATGTDEAWEPTALGTCTTDCAALPAVTAGTLSSTVVTTGTTVTLACNNGATPTGAATTTCTNGAWDPTALGTCTTVCAALTAPSGGTLSTTAVVTTTTVTLTCDDGSDVTGASTTTCTDGAWDPTALGTCPTGENGSTIPALNKFLVLNVIFVMLGFIYI